MSEISSGQIPTGGADAVVSGRLEQWAGTFGYSLLRQVRYVLAMVACGLIFHWVGAHLLASPWKSGEQNAAWGPAGSLGSELVLLIALAVAIFIGLLIIWPDTPHSGLLTAAVGLCVLAAQWGPINELLLRQHHGSLPRMYHVLMWQCLFWVVFVLAGEAISRFFYRLIFRNSLWLLLPGLDGMPLREVAFYGVGTTAVLSTMGTFDGGKSVPRSPLVAPDGSAGVGLIMPFTASAIHKGQVPRRTARKIVLDNAGGFVITGAIAALVLMVLMRSQFVGQVLFANFVAFGAGAFVAGAVFADVTAWAVWPAIPATAAVLYYFSMTTAAVYPGQAAVRMAGALPIACVGAGLAGAVLGYYTIMRVHLRQKWG